MKWPVTPSKGKPARQGARALLVLAAVLVALDVQWREVEPLLRSFCALSSSSPAFKAEWASRE